MLVGVCAWARADDWVTLAWDPNSEPDLGGYIVYYGVRSRLYTNAINVGNVTTNTVTGLVEGVLYYFAVTAYNTHGLESDYSDEVTYLAGGWHGCRLAVSSSNPAAGVRIGFNPAAVGGKTNDTTPFEVLYPTNTLVTLSAPIIAPTSNRFDYWRLDGAWAGTNPTLTVTMDRNRTAEPVYRATLTLLCAPNKTVQSGTAWDFDPPTVQASSGTATVAVLRTVTNSVGANSMVFTAARTWRATDTAGNQAECSQTVTVRDTTPPVVVCPPDLIVECLSQVPRRPSSLAEFVAAGGQASDTCGTNLAYVCDEWLLVDDPCLKILLRQHTVTDPCGNSATQDQYIWVQDLTAPEWVDAPAEVVVECGQVPEVAVVRVVDNCDPAPAVVLTVVTNAGPCAGTPVIVWRWVATDACGNAAVHEQRVRLQDATPPVVVCPPDLIVECLSQVPPRPSSLAEFVAAGGQASDTCGTNLAYVCDEWLLVDDPCLKILLRQHTVTDPCGNSATQDQYIWVQDLTAPEWVDAPAEVVVECGQVPEVAVVRVVDNCDPAPAVVLTVVTNAGPCAGTPVIVWRWVATDACGNAAVHEQRVRLQDTTPPALICAPDKTVECGQAWSFDPPLSFSDTCVGSNLMMGVQSTITNSTGQVGGGYVAERTWLATDGCGNRSTCTQRVTVQDTTVPVLVCAPDKTVEQGVPWEFDAPIAMDACGPVTVSVVATLTNLAAGQPLQVLRVWRATDLAGNRVQCSQTVTVLPPRPPVVLEVAAVGTETAVQIELSPEDLNGLGHGLTPLTRIYAKGTTVTLTAPAIGPGGEVFAGWQLDGQAWSTNTIVSLVMDTDHWLHAVYQPSPPQVWRLTVVALNADTGLMIALSPPDQTGAAGGTPPLNRTYPDRSLVTVTTPWVAGPYRFLKWQRNGADLSTNATVVIRIESDLTLTAVYAGPDPVAWWKLDETEGVWAVDSSASRLAGRLINGPAWTTGLFGQGLRFDGYNDFVAVSMPNPLDCVTNQFTIALWAKTTKTGPQALIEKGNLSWDGLLLLALNREGLGLGHFSVSDGRGGWLDSDCAHLADGAWHHLAVTYDGAVLRVYCDGQLDKAQRRPVSYAPSLFPLHIGRLATGNLGWWFEGVLDEIRWYNWALPESELARLGTPGFQWTVANPFGGGSTLMRPRILHVHVHPVHGATLHVQGQPGHTYQIRCSTDLVAWTVLGNATAQPDGEFVYQDTTAPLFSSRFYRVVEP